MGESLGLLTMAKLNESGFTNQDAVFLECKNMISELYEEVKSILLCGKGSLEAITALLIEKETIYHKDLITIIEDKSNNDVA